MLLRAYLAFGMAISLGFSAAALSGWRLVPKIAPGGAVRAVPGYPAGTSGGSHTSGGGHHTSGYHPTWHGGK